MGDATEIAKSSKLDRSYIVTLADGGYVLMGSPMRTDDIARASRFTESQAAFVSSHLAGASVSRNA